MNTRIKALLLALVLPFAACGEDGSVSAQGALDGAKKAVGDMDFSAMKPEAMKAKVGELTSTLAEKFSSVKDLASAEKLKGMAGPMLDNLGKLKTMLGDNMPSMESLGTAVNSLKDKFSGDSSMMNVLQPLIDKVKGMMG